jgi:hypothetical protein
MSLFERDLDGHTFKVHSKECPFLKETCVDAFTKLRAGDAPFERYLGGAHLFLREARHGACRYKE